MNILICDDELLAAEKIADLVSHFAAQRHLAVSVVKFTDVEKCMKSSLERCDIAFLDIDMKPYNGIDLARVLHEMPIQMPLSFLSPIILSMLRPGTK